MLYSWFYKIGNYIPNGEAFVKMIKFLSKYVDMKNKSDKLIIGGKNLRFDVKFLRKFFERNYGVYGLWFHYPTLDIETYLAEMIVFNNLKLYNYQLDTVCKAFDVKLENAHDAKSDTLATRELFYKLNGIEL